MAFLLPLRPRLLARPGPRFLFASGESILNFISVFFQFVLFTDLFETREFGISDLRLTLKYKPLTQKSKVTSHKSQVASREFRIIGHMTLGLTMRQPFLGKIEWLINEIEAESGVEETEELED